MSARARLSQARRVVVKVGSLLLAEDPAAFSRIGGQLADLAEQGREVVLVTSGAIALGLEPLGLKERPKDLPSLQAAAAAGQSRLMARWSEVLEARGRRCAQVLLTHADLQSRRRYLNARSALLRLLSAGLVPVVNENDTVSVEEIKLGDNDTLAAEVCGLVSADLVVLLTSAEGLMTGDPRTDPTAARVPVVEAIDDGVRALAGRPSRFGTGGMVTKLRAAEVARRHGAATVIGPGRRDGVLLEILRGGDVGTLFTPPSESPQRARKRWIAATLRPQGTLVVDEGAERALRQSASLLFAGVREVRGDFTAGDCVDIARLADGRVFARGLATLGAGDARKAAGLRTGEVEERLDGPAPDELVHRDDLALLD